MAQIDSEKVKKLSAGKLAVLYKGDLQAILKDPEILSCLTGVIGPYVIRHQNGKPIISRRVRKYRPSHSRKAIYIRNKFASAQKFAKFLNNIDILAGIWRDPQVRSYNRIIKQNVVKCGEFWPTDKNVITPCDYDFRIEDARIERNFLSLKMDDQYTYRSTDILKVILMVYDPINKNDNKFEMIDVCPAFSLFGTALNLSDEQLIICMRYRKSIYYVAVIRKDGEDMKWSGTFAVKAGRV